MADKKLKEKIMNKELVTAIGVGSPFAAKMAAASGFDCLYMTGYGVVAENFGFPDIGMVTMSEMAQVGRRICNAVDIPVIADADTGYGNSLNVRRTVQEYEAAGISVIQLEDQTWPKRCGHMAGKSLVPEEEMISKIKAAAEARSSDDFLIIARTDAIAVEGMEQAVERSKKYVENGADIIFIEAPTDPEDVKSIPKLMGDVPTLYNLAPRSPEFSTKELAEMGFAIAIYPGICLAANFYAVLEELKQFKETGIAPSFQKWASEFSVMNDFLGLSDLRALEEKYSK